MNNVITNLILFFISMTVIFVGFNTKGMPGLLTMLLGLALLIFDLYLYNRRKR